MTNEDVVYWKWINDTQIGLVMDRSVAHWDAMGGGAAPTKVFDRHATLEGAQIINYRASADGQWLVLVGILPDNNPGAFRIKGAMQLYSVARGVSQPIEGHAAAFSTIRLENAPEDTSLFSFAVRTATGAKVRYFLLMTLGRSTHQPQPHSSISSKSTTTPPTQYSRRKRLMCSSLLRPLVTSPLLCKSLNVMVSSTW